MTEMYLDGDRLYLDASRTSYLQKPAADNIIRLVQSSAEPGLVVVPTGVPSGNLVEFRSSDNVPKFAVDINYNGATKVRGELVPFAAQGTNLGRSGLRWGAIYGSQAELVPSYGGAVVLLLKGYPGGQTGDLQQWQDGAGNTVAQVKASGRASFREEVEAVQGGAYIRLDVPNQGIYVNAGAPLKLVTGGGEILLDPGTNQVRITNNLAVNGDVGIGTASPLAGLHIRGTAFGAQLGKAALVLENSVAAKIYRLYSRDNGYFYIANHTGNQDKFVMNPQGEAAFGDNPSPVPGVRLYVNGKLTATGDVQAANNIKVYESQWQAISGLGSMTLNHGLGTVPKMVIVWCAESASPTRRSVAGPFYVDSAGGSNAAGTHNHGGAVGANGSHSHTIPERGAYIDRVDATSLHVRAGNYIGINEAGDGWLTSGYYKVIAWA